MTTPTDARARVTKTCCRCELDRPVREFSVSNKARDGLQSWCGECKRLAAAGYRAVNNERERARDMTRRWRDVERARALERARRKRSRGRVAGAKALSDKRWSANNPEKIRAKHVVENSLKAGRITRPSVCEWCEKPCKPQATHGDYSKPLDVIWLCGPCHRIRDGQTSTVGIEAQMAANPNLATKLRQS